MIYIMVKITDVAREAGVSPSTVSHVLNGNRPISAHTKQLVNAAIDKLGYTPNAHAKALKSRKSGIIGFVASNITELFVTQIIRGVESVATPRGSHLVFTSSAEFDYNLAETLDFLKGRNLDGIIVSYGISQKDNAEDLPSLPFPLVTINRFLTRSMPCILPDNLNGGIRAAEHLIEIGAERFAMIAGPRNRRASTERLEGFKNTLERQGKELDESRIRYGDFTYRAGYDAMRDMLQQSPDFDGLFCANDHIAAGAIHAAENTGIRVPQDIAILGFDNREFTAFWPTPISTFSQPLEEMGRQSAKHLFDLIEGRSVPPTTWLHSTLIVRRSTHVL